MYLIHQLRRNRNSPVTDDMRERVIQMCHRQSQSSDADKKHSESSLPAFDVGESLLSTWGKSSLSTSEEDIHTDKGKFVFMLSCTSIDSTTLTFSCWQCRPSKM